MQFAGILQRLRDDTAGNALAICAAAILPLTAVIGSALDMSVAYMTRAKLQNACDAGVLAGRQFMEGTDFGDPVEAEAAKFFTFNFPAGTSGATGIGFTVQQDADNESQLIGTARASVPTSLMRIFGYDAIPLEVSCDATRDMGHNDIVLVLDVTGSMADAPSNGGGTKIGRLRTGAIGLYRALDSDDGSVVRLSILPYSHTVNVARSLQIKDILDDQPYIGVACTRYWNNGTCRTWAYTTDKMVRASRSSWNVGQGGAQVGGNRERFRVSGYGCIEERPSIGESLFPFRIHDTITEDDVDTRAGNAGNQPELQFGRYDPPAHTNTGSFTRNGVEYYRIGNDSLRTDSQVGCPAEATRLQTYESEDDFQDGIDAATARVTGGTYHDIGMLWALRFISRTGFFDSDNPTERDGIPVNQHIVFMTDGMLNTGSTLYTAYGIQAIQGRVQGGGNQDEKHNARFQAACDLAKARGITVWVIALDVQDTEDVEDCATSSSHFRTSNGADLEQVFEEIGQGIGNLRLTR